MLLTVPAVVVASAAFWQAETLTWRLLLAAALLLLGDTLLRGFSTAFTDATIEQRTLFRGRVVLAWEQVTDVERRHRGTIVLTGPPGRIVLRAWFYSNPKELDAFLRQRLSDKKPELSDV